MKNNKNNKNDKTNKTDKRSKLSTIIHNFFFCLRYPFYKSHNVLTGKFLGYGSTWYDDIPIGWRAAFGKQLSEEIRAQLKKDHHLRSFRFTEIKEKFGTLRIYHNGASRDLSAILFKYENISIRYCICCGAKAEYTTAPNGLGYIIPLCDNCYHNM